MFHKHILLKFRNIIYSTKKDSKLEIKDIFQMYNCMIFKFQAILRSDQHKESKIVLEKANRSADIIDQGRDGVLVSIRGSL